MPHKEHPVYEPRTTNIGRYSTRTRLRSQSRRRYRKQLNTKTILGAFIGVFISYFVLTARADDRASGLQLNKQPESVYRYEAPDLPPATALEQADPAREGIVVTEEKIEATAEEADALLKSLSRSRPGVHVSVPPTPVKAVRKAEDVVGKTEVAAEETITKEEKAGLWRRFADKFKRKKKPLAEIQIAGASGAVKTRELTEAADAKVAEASESVTGDVQEDAATKAEAAEARVEAAQPVVREDVQPWKPALPTFVVDGGDRISPQPQAAQAGLDQGNTVTRRSLPSPQDKSCRTFTFDASKSRDPDNDNLTYEWDFGDGSKKAEVARVKHTFPKAGEYKIKLTVNDHSGGQCETDATNQLLYVNSAPIAVGTFPRNLDVSEAGMFDARLSEDAENDRLSYKWEFGDGTTSEEPVASHRYDASGEYRVILTVKDDSGTQCDTNVVSSIVNVNKPLLQKPLLALAEPNPVRPIFEVPEAPVIAGEPIQDGILVQIRSHEGEDEPIRPQVAEAREEPKPEPHPYAQLVSTHTPLPQRIEQRPEESRIDPQYLPQTHKYVLAWAGGYMINGAPIQCGIETEASFQKRTSTQQQRLMKAINEERARVNFLEVSDKEKQQVLAERTRDLAVLDVKIDNVRTETRKANKNAVVQLAKEVTELREDHDLTSRKLFAVAARNAGAIKETADIQNQHQGDDGRHRSIFNPSGRRSPGETEVVNDGSDYNRLSPPPESNR